LDLTDRERDVYELRHSADPPLSWATLVERTGRSRSSLRASYKTAAEKLSGPDPTGMRARRLETRNPAKAAEVIDVMSDPQLDPAHPFAGVAKAAKECGVPVGTIHQLVARLDGEYQPVKRELQRVKTDRLVKQFENLATDSLDSITDADLKGSSAYQRVVMAAIATEKRELLDGRPTERLSHDDRRKLPELLETLSIEIERRGLMKEINPETGRAQLVAQEGMEPEVLAGRKRVEIVEAEVAP